MEPAGKVISVLVVCGLEGVCVGSELQLGWSHCQCLLEARERRGACEARPWRCLGEHGAGADTSRQNSVAAAERQTEWGADGGPAPGLGSEASLRLAISPTSLRLSLSSLLISGGVGNPTQREPHLYPGWARVPQRPAWGAISDTGLRDG